MSTEPPFSSSLASDRSSMPDAPLPPQRPNGSGIRRRLYWILGLIGVAALIAGGHVVWTKLKNPQRFPIRHVQVECPCKNITGSMIQTIVTPYAEQGFFGISLHPLRNQLAGLPGVQKVWISRNWPSTLNIKLAVMNPVAIWNSHSLIDASGIIFPRIDNAWEGLPLITAPDSDAPQAAAVLYLAETTLASDQLSVMGLTESPYVTWNLEVTNAQKQTFWLILGLNNLPLKLQRFATAYPSLIQAQPTFSRVDLRYANGIAVQ